MNIISSCLSWFFSDSTAVTFSPGIILQPIRPAIIGQGLKCVF